MHGRRPHITSTHGMVAAAHPLAAMAGARLLIAGGNAFDAIVATAAALNVVEPYFSGLAGMGIATAYVASESRVRVLDFISPVPRQIRSVPLTREELYTGPKGVATPCSLAGWCMLLETYGSRTREEVFAPAIELARDGFPLTEGNVDCIALAASRCAYSDEWRSIYAPHGAAVWPGEILHQPALARTLEALAVEGPSYLHSGPLGRAIVEQLQSLGGYLTLDDLAKASPQWVDSVASAFHGLHIHIPPPPCEAFQLLLTMRVLDGFDWGSLPRNGVDHLDVVVRAIRLAAAQRIRHNNAPRNVIAELLGDDVVGRLRDRVRLAAPVLGQTEQWGDPLPVGTLPDPTKEHTTSFSAADQLGNMVCITQSLGGAFGSTVVVPDTGVVLNDFLNWGDLNPASPNFLYPGAPLALPIAPSISLVEGVPVLALGTPGSYGICQTQAQVMVQHLGYGLDIQTAIDEPRVRVLDGAVVRTEARIPASVIEGLRERGHDASAVEPFTILVGGMQGISRDRTSGALAGGADPRRDGYAIGI